jgi:preprotein translocase subunit YajC
VNDTLMGILPLILLAAVFYLLIIRPQRNRQKQQQAMQAGLVPGTKVMTTSGIFATVRSVSPDAVELEIAKGVVVSAVPASINRIVEALPATPEPVKRTTRTRKTD